MIFIDTTVWVASFAEWHPHYIASRLLIADLEQKEVSCAAHSLAEVYATLTRLPGELRAPPSAAMRFLQRLQQRATIIALDTPEYLHAIEDLSRRGIGGAMIYDALLVACARKSGAERIYTWNLRHFRTIAPDLAQRIVAPGE